MAPKLRTSVDTAALRSNHEDCFAKMRPKSQMDKKELAIWRRYSSDTTMIHYVMFILTKLNSDTPLLVKINSFHHCPAIGSWQRNLHWPTHLEPFDITRLGC